MRDAQEPALIIWEPGLLSLSQAAPLLEWSPRLLVHEKALEEVLRWQVKIDGIIGTIKEGSPLTDQLEHQQPLKFIDLKGGLYSLFDWLALHKHTEINLVCPISTDWLKGLAPFLTSCQVQLIHAGWRYHQLQRPFEKWVPEEQLLKLIGKASITGAYQKEGGLFEAKNSGFVTIDPEPACWVGWPLG